MIRYKLPHTITVSHISRMSSALHQHVHPRATRGSATGGSPGVSIPRGEERLAQLNYLGADGWEMVSAESVWRWVLFFPAHVEDRLLLKRRKV